MLYFKIGKNKTLVFSYIPVTNAPNQFENELNKWLINQSNCSDEPKTFQEVTLIKKDKRIDFHIDDFVYIPWIQSKELPYCEPLKIDNVKNQGLSPCIYLVVSFSFQQFI